MPLPLKIFATGFILNACLAINSHSAVDTATCTAALAVPAGDCDALVALYVSTNGDFWNQNINWGTTTAPWYGVFVSAGRVTQLLLSSNDLSGTIPPELGDLDSLEYLYLYQNQLTGAIPPQLGLLGNLEFLYLYQNQLSGPIPPQLGDLSKLAALELGGNQLTGTIPGELGKLNSLVGLDLSYNQLTGSIPAELGNQGSLVYLVLNNNDLTGSIPPALGDLSNLESLYLFQNQLTGTLPLELGNLTSLNVFFVQQNQLDADPNGDGKALIPAELQSWYDGIAIKNAGNQTPPAVEALPGSLWRYKLYKDLAE